METKANKVCSECYLSSDGTVACSALFCQNHVTNFEESTVLSLQERAIGDREVAQYKSTDGYIQEAIRAEALSKRKWDKRFLSLADFYAQWSKDPSSKVGAVITRGKTQVSQGYNGFPSGTDDSPELYADRSRKYLRIIHAERNSLMFTPGVSFEGCTMYCTLPPCCQCTASIIQSKIKRIVHYYPSDDFVDRWAESILEATKMCEEAGVAIDSYSRI